MTGRDPPWERRGLLLGVRGEEGWVSHAQGPTVLELSPQLWRIYFAGRDAANRASVRAIDVAPGDGMRVVATHLRPMLSAGEPGSFDSMGVGPSCALRVGGRVHLYYTGVHTRPDVSFQLAIGLAVSDDGLSFRRACPGPVRAIGPYDPCFVSTPCVRPDGGGFRMWYMSGTGWRHSGARVEPAYVLRTCWSPDGLHWESESRLSLAPRGEDTALGRPWVTAGPEGLRLWYCHRGDDFRAGGEQAYRIASQMLDAAGVAIGSPQPARFAPAPRAGDFDDWMQAYACVVPCDEGEVMFYNGNGFGQHGFGWAVRHRQRAST